jgi:glycosyltransferase involved in cell wall biosynthesis
MPDTFMNGKARISVVTVVLNGARLLEETIQSVIEKKSTAEIDYLIIDGGSTDGTVDIIRSHSNQIAYWVSERDSGIYEAMNKGWLAAADGSFILFLGAGDRLVSLPDNISCFGCNDVLYGNVLMGDKKVFTARTGYHLKLYNSLHHQALLVNKSCHPAAPFNTRYRLYADFDFNQRLMKSRANFVYLPTFTTFARPGGLSDRQSFSESLRIIRNNYGIFWVLLALGGWIVMKIFPLLKRLRPFQEV